jgi:hypothetical protein
MNSSISILSFYWFPVCLLFDPENGRITFLLNDSKLLPDCTACVKLLDDVVTCSKIYFGRFENVIYEGKRFNLVIIVT